MEAMDRRSLGGKSVPHPHHMQVTNIRRECARAQMLASSLRVSYRRKEIKPGDEATVTHLVSDPWWPLLFDLHPCPCSDLAPPQDSSQLLGKSPRSSVLCSDWTHYHLSLSACWILQSRCQNRHLLPHQFLWLNAKWVWLKTKSLKSSGKKWAILVSTEFIQRFLA